MARRTHILAVLLASLGILGACGRGSDGGFLAAVRSAQSGFRVSALLLSTASAAEVLPAALAGLQTSAILVGPGAEPVPSLGGGGAGNRITEDAELLQRLIDLLSEDIQTMLNRSTDRAGTVDEYLATLSTNLQAAQIRLRALANAEDDLTDDERRLRRAVDELRDNLDDTLSAGQGENIGPLTTDLLERQRELAEVETDLAVTSRLHDALEDILEPVEERKEAVSANRDPLIKGVRVVDIPGIEELGIIEVEGGVRRIRGRR